MSEGMSLSAPDGHLFFESRTTVDRAGSHLFHVVLITVIRTQEIVRVGMHVWQVVLMMVHLVILALASGAMNRWVAVAWLPEIL